jgi:phosphoadenosine phosphosulfate reductase
VTISSFRKLITTTIKEIRKIGSKFENVYAMFSGGRDSLVTLHLSLRALKNKVEALFIDTGISTPGLKEYVESIAKEFNVKLNIVSPKYNYFELVLKKGFPTITRRWCKEYLKLKPLKDWINERDPEKILLITGVRADESWMKARTKKLLKHKFLKTTTYAPILYWTEEEVKEYIKFYKLRECPLYETYGKAYDCWCSVFKSPADFATLALNNPEFFKKFVKLESKLRSKGSGLYYSGKKIYFKDIAINPENYLNYPKLYKCPLCTTLV